MSFFPELLDTARILPEEIRAAKTILMLAALRPEPCELPTVTAINSKLVLDECDDAAFYDLIIHGRIRFRWSSHADGRPRSPREEFCERIGLERYFFYAWPETSELDEAGGYTNGQDICELVRRIMQGDPTSTGIASLDARLSGAKELFAAIEQATFRKQELPRSPAFQQSLRAAVSDIPDTEEFADIRAVVATLAADPTIDRRSKAWRAIEARSLGELREAQAKDVVNAAYNSAVAHSLEAKLLSSRRLVPLGSAFHRAANPAAASIRCFETTRPTKHLRALEGRAITWTGVRAALSGQLQPLSSYGADAARTALARDLAKQEWLVGGTPVVTATLGAALGGLAPGALAAVGLAGALTGWATIPLAMLGSGAFVLVDKAASAAIESRRTEQIKRDLDGWLDATE